MTIPFDDQRRHWDHLRQVVYTTGTVPTHRQLGGLRAFVESRGWVYYTQCHLVKHRTDHLRGWYA